MKSQDLVGHPVVAALAELEDRGIIHQHTLVTPSWYATVKDRHRAVCRGAIDLLQHIVYYHLPKRDADGRPAGTRFWGEAFHLNVKDRAEVQSAHRNSIYRWLHLLASLGLVRLLARRNVEIKGFFYSNGIHVEPAVEALQRLWEADADAKNLKNKGAQGAIAPSRWNHSTMTVEESHHDGGGAPPSRSRGSTVTVPIQEVSSGDAPKGAKTPPLREAAAAAKAGGGGSSPLRAGRGATAPPAPRAGLLPEPTPQTRRFLEVVSYLKGQYKAGRVHTSVNEEDEKEGRDATDRIRIVPTAEDIESANAFFDLNPKMVKFCAWLYARASLVAGNKPTRSGYRFGATRKSMESLVDFFDRIEVVEHDAESNTVLVGHQPIKSWDGEPFSVGGLPNRQVNIDVHDILSRPLEAEPPSATAEGGNAEAGQDQRSRRVGARRAQEAKP